MQGRMGNGDRGRPRLDRSDWYPLQPCARAACPRVALDCSPDGRHGTVRATCWPCIRMLPPFPHLPLAPKQS